MNVEKTFAETVLYLASLFSQKICELLEYQKQFSLHQRFR